MIVASMSSARRAPSFIITAAQRVTDSTIHFIASFEFVQNDGGGDNAVSD